MKVDARARTQAANLPTKAAALRRTVAALPPSAGSPDEVRLWTETRADLGRRLTTEDATSFLSWEPVRRTLVISEPPYVRSVLRNLKGSTEWRSRWRSVLNEDYVGLPQPTLVSPFSSGTLIHHAGLVHAYERHSGRRISTLRRIVEFGGGYGSMMRLIYRLGFTGSYHVHDFPELGAIQRFFYELTIDAEREQLDDRKPAPTFSDSIDDILVDKARPEDSAFIATWSLSETPVSSREEWRPVLDRFQHFLFGYRDIFDGHDNVAWFARIRQERRDIEWREVTLPHMPGQLVLVGAPSRHGARS